MCGIIANKNVIQQTVLSSAAEKLAKNTVCSFYFQQLFFLQNITTQVY